MKKFTILLVLLLLSTFQAEAQRLQITNFKNRINDLTARTNSIRDFNGDLCGLIRVQFAGGDMTFEGNVTRVEKITSEYLVWMTPSSRRLTIRVPGYLPVEVDFKEELGLEKGIQSGSTYVMVIEDSQYANKTEPDDKRNRETIVEMIKKISIAYEKKDIAYLEKLFSKNTRIVNGRKIVKKDSTSVVYTRSNNDFYFKNLKRAFMADNINLKYEIMSITSHPNNYYCARVQHHYSNSRYSDAGYLFLVFNFSDELKPTIDVCSWQPIETPENDLLTMDDIKPYLSASSSMNSQEASNNNNYTQNTTTTTQLKVEPKQKERDVATNTNSIKKIHTSPNNDSPRQQAVTAAILMPDVDKDIPLTTVKNPNILAVIIGNEKYSKLPDVPYAENDAKMFKEYCVKTLGVTEKHIRYLPNAGYVDIRGAMNWLKTGTGSMSGEASVIFYYAGHGLPDPKTGSQFILPADVDGKDLDLTISLQKLYDDLGQMPARSVAIFLDACFSGTNRDNKLVAENSGVRLAFGKSKQGTPSGKTVIFSATKDDETAHPFKDQKHGFFTYFLLRKLQESKGDATFGEIADYVTKNVKRAVFDEIQTSQTPSVKPSDNLSFDWRQMKLK